MSVNLINELLQILRTQSTEPKQLSSQLSKLSKSTTFSKFTKLLEKCNLEMEQLYTLHEDFYDAFETYKFRSIYPIVRDEAVKNQVWNSLHQDIATSHMKIIDKRNQDVYWAFCNVIEKRGGVPQVKPNKYW